MKGNKGLDHILHKIKFDKKNLKLQEWWKDEWLCIGWEESDLSFENL